MPIKLEGFQQLTVISETLLAPPPYSHTYQFILQPWEGQLKVTYQLSYTERETLTEEEVLEEGFTMQDDYAWEGSLPAVWHQATMDMLRQTTRLRAQPKADMENVVVLQVRDQEDHLQEGIPDNVEAWEYFLQEMTQAAFEVSQKEQRLVIRFLEISEADKKLEITLQPAFSTRELLANIYENGRKQEKYPSWAKLKPLLKAIYLPDYDESKASQRQPAKAGKYIDPGEGVWYELYHAVVNPGKQYDAVSAMEKEIKGLL